MSTAPGRDPSSRQVSNILHALRGEHYRHEQNLQRAKAHAPAYQPHNNPTLPFDQIYSQRTVQLEPAAPPRLPPPVRLGPEGILEYTPPAGGPRPPPSWGTLFDGARGGRRKRGDVLAADEHAWRANVLSLMYSHLPSSTGSNGSLLPRLTMLCLQFLLSLYSSPDMSDAFATELVPWLPVHLRRDLLRWSAVHEPLTSSKLFALADPNGHIGGELVIVGPQASLPRDYFKARKSTPLQRLTTGVLTQDPATPNGEDVDECQESWDSPSSELHAPSPVQVLVLVSTPLPVNTLLTFPPTLTHLALVSLPSPTPIFRLPRVCPLIEVLDLSFNRWLSKPNAGNESTLDRVQWERWSRLRVLGLRDTGVGEEVALRVNKDRWVDVEIVSAELLDIAMRNLTLSF